MPNEPAPNMEKILPEITTALVADFPKTMTGNKANNIKNNFFILSFVSLTETQVGI
jgi:hypothetical protein